MSTTRPRPIHRLIERLWSLPLLGLLLASTGSAWAGAGTAAGQAAAKPAPAATPPVAAAAETTEDPMERLRQRLAERLAATKVNESSSQFDLRVATPAPAPAARTTPRREAAARPAAASRSGSGATPAEDGHGWSYGGPAGPQTWGGLKPEFAQCSSGQRQSPIDIRGGLAVDLEKVNFEYQASRFAVVDNGHTVQVNVAPGNAIEVGGRRYELVQFHFHRPSEERIDGRQFEMSLHLVHRDADGRLAVVAVLLDKGPALPAVQTVWNNLPLERHSEVAARVLLNPVELLPADRRYFTYMGSLTTPPCTEGVLWVVMRTPQTATAEQLDLFARIYPMNARPVQNAAGRRILQSN
jgi:carbonic anhydrase